MDQSSNAGPRAYLILLAMPLFFSSNMVIGRAAVAVVEPWTLAFWRWLIAFVILAPIVLPALVRHRAALLAEWKTIIILGFLATVICGAGVYLSLKSTTATNALLIYTSSPIFVLLMEIVFRGHRTSPRQVIGIALAFLGVAAILLRGDLGRLLTLQFNPGDLGMAVVAFGWAIYSVILKRPELTKIPTMVMFAIVALAGTLCLLPAVIWEFVALHHFPTTAQAWASILGLALIPSVLAFTSYQYGIKAVGPSVTSIFLYLLPAYGVVLAVVFLGEELRAYHGAGFALVICGVMLATAPAGLWRRRSTVPRQ